MIKIRRKAHNVDNPVQAAGAARGRKMPLYHMSCVAVQPASGLRAQEVVSLTPSCAALARGYQRVRPAVFLKQRSENAIRNQINNYK